MSAALLLLHTMHLCRHWCSAGGLGSSCWSCRWCPAGPTCVCKAAAGQGGHAAAPCSRTPAAHTAGEGRRVLLEWGPQCTQLLWEVEWYPVCAMQGVGTATL